MPTQRIVHDHGMPGLGMLGLRMLGLGMLGLGCLAGCALEAAPPKTSAPGTTLGTPLTVTQFYSRPNDNRWEILANCEARKSEHDHTGECTAYETAIIGVHGKLENQTLRISYGAMMWTLDRSAVPMSKGFRLQAWTPNAYEAMSNNRAPEHPRPPLDDAPVAQAPLAVAPLWVTRKAQKMTNVQADWPLDFSLVDNASGAQPVAWATLDLPTDQHEEGVIEVVAPHGRAASDGQVAYGREVQQRIHWSVANHTLHLDLESLPMDAYYNAYHAERQAHYAALVERNIEEARPYLEYMRAHGVDAVIRFSPTVCVHGDCPVHRKGDRHPPRVLKDGAMLRASMKARDDTITTWWETQDK